MERYKSLCELFEYWEQHRPDLMERYSTNLAEAQGADERVRIMRRGLRETIAQRYPLTEVHTLVAHDERQGALQL